MAKNKERMMEKEVDRIADRKYSGLLRLAPLQTARTSKLEFRANFECITYV